MCSVLGIAVQILILSSFPSDSFGCPGAMQGTGLLVSGECIRIVASLASGPAAGAGAAAGWPLPTSLLMW